MRLMGHIHQSVKVVSGQKSDRASVLLPQSVALCHSLTLTHVGGGKVL